MKNQNLVVRMGFAQKQKLKTMAEDKGVTLSKHVTDLIDKVSVQLLNKNYDPQMEKIADMLEASLRLLTKVKKVELATHGEGSRSTQQTVFDYAEAILQWSQFQLEGKPINTVLSAIKRAKLNQRK
jgi:hypothetical protein